MLLSLLFVVVVFYGCASAPPQPEPTPTPEPTPEPGFTIDARTHKAAYNIGEEVVISIRADESCYVSIFNLSADGSITRLFPNGLATNNYIQGQQIYHVPSQADRFRLKVSGPRGTEQIRVIECLQTRMQVLGGLLLCAESRLFQLDTAGHEFRRRLIYEQRSIWGECAILPQFGKICCKSVDPVRVQSA